MGESTRLGMLVCSSKTEIILPENVDDINMAGKKQNTAPMWKKMMEMWILTNQLHLTLYTWVFSA